MNNKKDHLTIVLITLVLGASLTLKNASASEANWSTGFLMETTGGTVNPALLVAFNPQPEPPAWTGETTSALVGGRLPTVLEQKVTNISNPEEGLQNFQFLFAVASDAGSVLPIIPPDPINEFRIGFSIIDGRSLGDFTAVVDVQSSSGGVMAPGSELMFNPQPEPPAFGFENWATYGLDFGMTSLSDVTLTVRIEDSAGNPLNLAAIPEPATQGMFLVALLRLSFFRRKRRQSGVRHA